MSASDRPDFRANARWLRQRIKRARKAEADDGRRDSADRSLRTADTEAAIIRVECYRYYWRLKIAGQKELADYLNDARARWRRHPKRDVTNALRLLEDGETELFLSNPRRERIAEELRIAFRFGIHSKLLLA